MVDPTKSHDVTIAPDRVIQLGNALDPAEEKEYVALLYNNHDNFAWTHMDLKGVSPELVEHRIDLVEGAVPVRTRQYRLNPKYSLMVKQELEKLLEAGVIYPVLNSEWVSPIVIAPKKVGKDGKQKIRICQDFRKLNQQTKKDHFPLPFNDVILDKVAGHERYSFLDGFSGYNQVHIREEDQPKTTFTMDWGTFAYRRMPFGLCNAPATFQRLMTTVFSDFLRQFLEIFIDDFCVYSDANDHLRFVESTTQRCKDVGISLHPGKSYFGMEEGILLGHRVSKIGIRVDPDKIQVIVELEIPENLT